MSRTRTPKKKKNTSTKTDVLAKVKGIVPEIRKKIADKRKKRQKQSQKDKANASKAKSIDVDGSSTTKELSDRSSGSSSGKGSQARAEKRKAKKANTKARKAAMKAQPEAQIAEPKIQSPITSNGVATNGLTDNADFISLNMGDSDDEVIESKDDTPAKPNAFAKVAAKLGKFVQESVNPLKRKKSEASGKDKKRKKQKADAPQLDIYPWLKGVSYHNEREPARILHREILDFVKFVGPTEAEHLVRTFVISRIRKVVEEKWPTSTLRVFGSFETKLYLPTSDIDLVVLSSPEGEIYEKPAHLRKLANWLVKARIAENIQVITSARVPIIKFVDSVTKLHVDISFNKPGGLVTAGVVKRYTELMPALRPLVIFIKHFLNMRGMNEVYLGGLGSYSIICMVISFLQRHPKIATGQIKQEDNLGVLIVEFFELYGKRFNYDNVGISINNQGQYFSKLEYGWQRPGQTYLLSIEDPTDPENDIAKSSFGILKVKSTLGGGHDFLIQRLYDVNDRVKERRRGDVLDDSILTAVVSIDEDIKESREMIARSFESAEVQEELARLEESEGEIHEVPSLDLQAWDKQGLARTAQSGAPMFVAHESEDDDLIDNDGLKFVRPNGYKPPSSPAATDELYQRLNGKDTGNGSPKWAQKNDDVYLIESSDEEAKSKRADAVIDIPSSGDEKDSKVDQIGKSARSRYWEAKADKTLVDHYDSDHESD